MSQSRKKIIDIKDHRKRKPDVILDDVFFHKSQVNYGTHLRYLGRLNPNSIWEVVGIQSHFLGAYVGEVKLKKVNEIRLISDLITVKNMETGDTKKVPFIYLSYSAIWRLS